MERVGDLVVSATRSVTDPALKRDVAFQMPAVISHRLDQLVQLLEADELDSTGRTFKQRTTTRKELVSALIFHAPSDCDELEQILERYRAGTTGDAVIPRRSSGRIRLPGQPPGIRLTTDQRRERDKGRTAPPRRRYREIGNR
jgi:hypothetical protein